MQLVSWNDDDGKEIFYLPRHPVFIRDRNTATLRVVFDASAKSTNRHFLSDELLVGPTIQQDLFSVFLTHQIGFTSDIVKIYRQIRVHPKDMVLRPILWKVHLIRRVRFMNSRR